MKMMNTPPLSALILVAIGILCDSALADPDSTLISSQLVLKGSKYHSAVNALNGFCYSKVLATSNDEQASMTIRLYSSFSAHATSGANGMMAFVSDVEAAKEILLPWKFKERLLASTCDEGKWSFSYEDSHSTVDSGPYTVKPICGSNDVVVRGDGSIHTKFALQQTLPLLSKVAAVHSSVYDCSQGENVDLLAFAVYENGEQGFPLTCVSPAAGKVKWNVDCRGADWLYSPGRCPQFVEIRIVGEEVRVFGIGHEAFFMESYDIETAEIRWRFCSKGVCVRQLAPGSTVGNSPPSE